MGLPGQLRGSTAALFVGLVLAMWLLVVLGVYRADMRRGARATMARARALAIAAALWLWLAVMALLAARGFFAEFGAMPPRLLLALLPPLAVLVILARSRTVGEWLDAVPPAWLVHAQAFRIVVEIALWRLVVEGVAPHIMSFTGRNFDILVGLTAPVVARVCLTPGARRQRWAAWWNVAGILILANTVVHAFLAAPTPLRIFLTSPPNVFVAHFPFIWLPGFLVPVAFALHLLSLRQLRRGAA
jgi:hypothetical protein